jgi:hypothetical protein
VTPLEVAKLAEHLVLGYYAQAAISELAGRPEAINLLPANLVPVNFLVRKDGSRYSFDPRAFLNLQKGDAEMVDDFKRVWPAGALLTLADALDDADYFDHAPLLEMIYHLRNGVAHGNQFRIRNLHRLERYPAHSAEADIKGGDGRIFEVTPALNGQQVLFAYMDAGDVQDLLDSVASHLRRLAKTD